MLITIFTGDKVMTIHKINEIVDLINQQSSYITNLKSQFEIALQEGFMDLSKAAIHYHLCLMDDQVDKLAELNQMIGFFLKERG
jgi:hypothetical protein